MRRALIIIALLAVACPGEWSERTEKVDRIAVTPNPLDDPEVRARLEANHEARVLAFAPTTPDPTPTPRPVVSRRAASSSMQRTSAQPTGDIWYRLAYCETGGRMDNPVSKSGKYRGYFQFSLKTWASVGGPGDPIQHSYEVQRYYAQLLQKRSGWGQWPECSYTIGAR